MPKRKAKLLIVEDDPADQELIKRALEKSDFDDELFFVDNGEEALDYLYHREKYSNSSKHPRPDLMFLDLNMPKVDGFQVLEAVRKDSYFNDLVIIVFTTSEYSRDKFKTYDLGVNFFATKPICFEDFLKTFISLRENWIQEKE